MKILMISNYYPPVTFGGYELSCKKISNELKRRGHDISIITSNLGVEPFYLEENIHRLLFIDPTLDSKKNNRDYFQIKKRIAQIRWAFTQRENYKMTHELISAQRPDLAIFWNMSSIGLGPILAIQEKGIPGIFNIGDYWLLILKLGLCNESNIIKKKYRALINGIKGFEELDLTHIMMNSNYIKKIYVQNGFLEENILVIPRGILSKFILPINSLGDLPRIHNGVVKLLFVGRLVPDKAPDIAIKAIEILIKKYGLEVELDIIGQGSEEYVSGLKNLISELKLENKIRFIDWMDPLLLFDKYPNYDILLFPSRWEEPVGNIIMEAMARGLPVIASNHGGPVEFIKDGENGLLVEGDNPLAFADAIIRLLQNDKLTQKIRAAGIKTILERFTLEVVVDQYLEYFQKILAFD